MKPSIEKVSNKANFSWRVQHYHCENPSFDWHYHFEYEIVLQRHLKGTLFAGDYIGALKHNNLMMFAPKLPHTSTLDDDFDQSEHITFVIWFSQQWLNTLCEQFPELIKLKGLAQQSAQGLQFPEQLAEQIYPLLQDYQQISQARLMSRVIDILVQLSECRSIKKLNHYSQANREENPKELKLVQQISNYIDQHFQQPIKAQDLCEQLHVSESTLYRVFEKHFVCSFSQHLNEYRLGKACELLINSNCSIAAIANQVGFNNLSNFNRRFKTSKSMTPKQFRLLFA